MLMMAVLLCLIFLMYSKRIDMMMNGVYILVFYYVMMASSRHAVLLLLLYSIEIGGINWLHWATLFFFVFFLQCKIEMISYLMISCLFRFKCSTIIYEQYWVIIITVRSGSAKNSVDLQSATVCNMYGGAAPPVKVGEKSIL